MATKEDKLRTLFVEHLGVDADKVVDDAHLFDDLGGDSLDRVEIGMAIEEDFNIEVTDDEMDKAETFGDWLRLIEAKA